MPQHHARRFAGRFFPEHPDSRSALNGCLVEETLDAWHCVQAGRFCSATRFAEDHYVVRVTAKCFDVGVHPLECVPNIQQTLIPGSRVLFACEFPKIQISQKPQPVIAAHDNHIIFAREIASVLQRRPR